ncbi:hypothetical protein A3743_01620, partial [Oleiphilus sp. HI0072]
EISSGLDEVILRFHIDPQQVTESRTFLVIAVLTLLVSLIVTGLSMSFVYTKKMQQLYRLQNNFINNFTHELKTPVTSLQLYLETFQKHDLDKETQQKYLNYMLRDVHRLSDNISNILDLGKIESQSFSDEFIELDVAEFVSQFYQQNAHLFTGLQIATQSSQPIKQTLSRALFEMLLINLASNALKYNESDQPSLVVKIEKLALRGNDELRLRFIDNGIGIEHTQRKKVFKKFYQVGDSKTRSAQGSGLGLYLVQNIVKAHSGKIQIKESQPGQGAEFVIIFPQRNKLSMAKRARNMMGMH